jgi:hypothetical protein
MDQSSVSLDSEGFTRISWGQKDALRLKENDVLFTIHSAKAAGNIIGLLMQDEVGLYPEVYTEGLDNQVIELAPFLVSSSSDAFESMVTPNPFTDNTTLKVTIPVGSDFTVSVYDIKGQEIFKRHYTSTQGTTEIFMGSDLIGTAGMYYYRVQADRGELSGKFIRQ